MAFANQCSSITAMGRGTHVADWGDDRELPLSAYLDSKTLAINSD